MRRSERIAATIAAASLGILGMLGGYAAHGSILPAPIVITVPDSVMNVVCGVNTLGCYRNTLPDLVILSTEGKQDDATLPHEMLHYAHHGWSECEVSLYLYATTGLTDGYYGRC